MSAQTTFSTFEVREAETTETVDVIYTVNGGPELCRKLHSSPELLLGYESHRTRPSNGEPVAFVDWPFNREFDPDFEDHLEVVMDERPRLAVAPDVEGGRSLEDVLALADQLDSYVTEAVIVVPKEAHPGDIPDRFRVGVPLAGWGSEDERNHITAYQEADSLHFLGGTPSTQADAIKKHGLIPDSVDGSSVGKAAGFGDIWCQLDTPQYISIADDVMDEWDSSEIRTIAARERMPYIDRTIQALHNTSHMFADLFDYEVDVPYYSGGEFKTYSHTVAGLAGRGPPPCQHPDCIEFSVAENRYITCEAHEPY